MFNPNTYKAVLQLAKKNIEEMNETQFKSDDFKKCIENNKILVACEFILGLSQYPEETEINEIIIEEYYDLADKLTDEHLKVKNKNEIDEEDKDLIFKRMNKLIFNYSNIISLQNEITKITPSLAGKIFITKLNLTIVKAMDVMLVNEDVTIDVQNFIEHSLNQLEDSEDLKVLNKFLNENNIS